MFGYPGWHKLWSAGQRLRRFFETPKGEREARLKEFEATVPSPQSSILSQCFFVEGMLKTFFVFPKKINLLYFLSKISIYVEGKCWIKSASEDNCTINPQLVPACVVLDHWHWWNRSFKPICIVIFFWCYSCSVKEDSKYCWFSEEEKNTSNIFLN